MYVLDELDKKILNRIQEDFPIHPRPYQVLGLEFNISEEDTFKKVMNLKKKGIIRRTGAIFNAHKLKYHSSLCAAKVEEKYINSFAEILNKSPKVSHNYLRNNEYNIWFTLTGKSQIILNKFIANLKTEKGVIDILTLPVIKMYKIKAVFNFKNA